MPLYRFELGSKLESTQMSQLAEEITEWHARAFTIPAMAISCHFQDVSDDHTFAGGKPKKGNRLVIHQRTANQNVPMEQLEAHAQAVISLWRKAVFGDRELSLAEEQAHSNALHGIYMVNSIGLAYEYGVFLPMVCETNGPYVSVAD